MSLLILPIVETINWSTLRFRTWTLSLSYRLNRVLSILLQLQIQGQVLINRLDHFYCLIEWPRWINLEMTLNHSNTLTISKDMTIKCSIRPKQLSWHCLDLLRTSPKHMHKSFFDVCIWQNINSTHDIIIYRIKQSSDHIYRAFSSIMLYSVCLHTLGPTSNVNEIYKRSHSYKASSGVSPWFIDQRTSSSSPHSAAMRRASSTVISLTVYSTNNIFRNIRRLWYEIFSSTPTQVVHRLLFRFSIRLG